MTMRNKVEELAPLNPLLEKKLDDTLDEDAEFGKFVNPRGRQREGR